MSKVGEPLAEAILSLQLNKVARVHLIERLNKLSKHLGDYGVDGAIPVALQAAQYGWDEKPQASEEEDEEWDDAEYDEKL